MPSFEELSEQLRRAQAAAVEARDHLRSARNELGALEAQVVRRGRQRGAGEDASARLAVARDRLAPTSDKLVDARKALGIALAAFGEGVDPREAIGQLDDQTPILMLPLRLETRFRQTRVTGITRDQLCVRVFPDDCSIDSFEAELSDAEVESGRKYWIASWRAGGSDGLERDAWRSLCGSHGTGRAEWIRAHYEPLQPDLKPTRSAASDVILVIPTETALPAPELAALVAYWSAVWVAGDAKAPVDGGRAALDATVGTARATALLAAYVPANLDEVPAPPRRRTDVAVTVSVLVLPAAAAAAAKRRSWSRPAQVRVMPERLVFIGWSGGTRVEHVGATIRAPLDIGPDPSAPPADQLHEENGQIVAPDELAWLVDFERAVEAGMGFVIDLTAAQASTGFDRIIVCGVKLMADATQGRMLLEELLQHHRFSRTGAALLPQGTPTNNTEASGSGFSRTMDADLAWDALGQRIDPTSDELGKTDGQWLAEWLGIDLTAVANMLHARGHDQSEARSMNAALWPATLGYWMETMMHPLLDAATVESARAFFTRYVSGRGPVPALRIGAQPYGILPTTRFSTARWFQQQEQPFIKRMYDLIRKLDVDWTSMSAKVQHVGAAGDAHKILLDVIGLHPTSVEYYQRYSQSIEQLFNTANLRGFGAKLAAALAAFGYVNSGQRLLQHLGHEGDATPDILHKLFLGSASLLDGAVIDDRPLSETAPIRAYAADGRNYMQWLADSARTSVEALRRQDGFASVPTALLYLLARHALILGYRETGLRLYHRFAVLPPEVLIEARREQPFVHVTASNARANAASADVGESRWSMLYQPQAQITGSATELLGDYIARQLAATAEANHLAEQIGAVQRLSQVPTARLERLFAEHIDLCSYRLDAWRMGVIHAQLSGMRLAQQQPRKGIYLGAYAWLEDVRPKASRPAPFTVEPALRKVFEREQVGLVSDPTNGGYIHAPSLDHAVTAAVLRSGYLANATPSAPDALAVNLSSERVRAALSILDGIRNGQSLGALLGYQLERGLHDRYSVTEVDEFIYVLRRAFPLRADKLVETRVDLADDEPIENIEARNVVDALALVEHIRKSGYARYPFGLDAAPFSLTMPAANGAQQAAINAEIDRVLDAYDAVADLSLAEGVHQAVRGNFDRSAAALDAVSKGTFPPDPEVIQTPRSGATINHRVGLQLEAGVDPAVSPITGLAMTPRATAECALNKWLSGVLPLPSQVGCRVQWINPLTGASEHRDVTQQQLGLQPLDLVHVLRTENRGSMDEIDDRVMQVVYGTAGPKPRPDAETQILYVGRAGGLVPLFELEPLVATLRAIVTRSRPLRATDTMLHSEARAEQDDRVSIPRDRLARVRASLETARGELATLQSALALVFTDPVANRAAIVAAADSYATRLVTVLSALCQHGLAQAGWGAVFAWKRRVYSGVIEKVKQLVARWNETLLEFDKLIAKHDALPASAVAERADLLARADRLVSTTPTGAPTPATVAAKRAAFEAKRVQFVAILGRTDPSLSALCAGVAALLPIGQYDRQPFDLTEQEDEVLAFLSQQVERLASLLVQTNLRLVAAADALVAHDAAIPGRARVDALQAGARAIFGEDFVLVPEFELGQTHADEWGLAVAGSPALLDHLTNVVKTDFPVDDWMLGLARVREKLGHWERLTLLADGFGRPVPGLVPIQLPYRAGDSWLALEFPATTDPDGNRLLYTAHYTVPFVKTARQCGLLIDEWNEVIPRKEETTGVAFHFDRPTSEAPQTMLLVTPPAFTGHWNWQDLEGALTETLDWAKTRAVEPVHLDAEPYARFLPATVMAVTLYQITISTNLALNIGALAHIEAVNG